MSDVLTHIVREKYGNLPTLVGVMTRSAIDAYMWQQGWYIWPNEERYHPRPDVALNSAQSIGCPSWDGVGGGDWKDLSPGVHYGPATEYVSSQMTGQFDEIRSRIRIAIGNLDELPNPDGFNSVAHRVAGVRHHLVLDETLGGDDIEVSLQDAFNKAEVALTSMGGITFTLFNSNYLQRLHSTVILFYKMVQALEAALRAEGSFWQETRDIVVRMVASATGSFSTYAHQQVIEELNWGMLFALGKAILAGVGFAMPGNAGIIGIAGAIFECFTRNITADTATAKTPTPTDYDGVMGAFEESLTELIATVASKETDLNDALVSLQDLVNQNDASFDLAHPFRNVDDPGKLDMTGVITLDDTFVNMLTDGLSYIYDSLLIASNELLSGLDNIPWIRPEGLGYSAPTGCYRAWSNLLYWLHDRISDASEEVIESKIKLKLLIQAFRDHDNSAANQFHRYSDAINGYNPYNLN